VVACRVYVDGPSVLRGDEDDAVGCEGLALQLQDSGAQSDRLSEFGAPRVKIAKLGDAIPCPGGLLLREKLDDTGKRLVSPGRRAAPGDDLRALERVGRDGAPGHPSPEGVVQGDPVEEDERAACAAWPQAPERDTLRCRIRGHAVIPSKKAEISRIPEGVVHRERDALVKRRLGDDLDGEGHLGKGLRRAGRAHRHRVEGFHLP